MGQIIGNVAWAEFPDKIYIARDEKANILLGDILKITDFADPKKDFLIRVTGALQAQSTEALAIARRIMADAEFKKVAEARGSGDLFVGTLLCSFKFDDKGNKKPYIPKELPTRFSDVGIPDYEDLRFIENLKNNGYDLEIGILRVRGDNKIKVCIKGADLPRHVSVYAITGKGKTGFVKTLLYSFAKAPAGKYGALVYDAHDEYYKTIQAGLVGLKELNLDNIHYYDLHEERTPKIALTSMSAYDFLSVFSDLTSAQIDTCILAHDILGDQWLVSLSNLQYENIDDFCSTTFRGLVKPVTVKALLRKVKILASRPCFIQQAAIDFITEIQSKLDAGNICIVNTRNLTDLEERAVLSVATSKLIETRKRLLDENPESLLQKPITLIILEEALSVLSERVLRRGSNVFVDLVREGRKYRIGLLCVVQIPHRLDPDVAGNINTNVILGLAQDKGRRAVADSAMDDMDPLIDEMKMLDVGEAIISYPHKGEVPFPLPVIVHYFNDLVAQHKASGEPKKPKPHKAFGE
ncbi:MAG: ATP-binding protein [Candidatus Bathyarchaeia archaeon]|jgi:hypothetical protein